MPWTIYDRGGRIAVTIGWQPDWDRPVEVRHSIVGRATVAEWPDLVGRTVEFTGNRGIVRLGDSRWVVINSDDAANWERVVEERPVKKPRRGKDYDWEWRQGGWRKAWK